MQPKNNDALFPVLPDADDCEDRTRPLQTLCVDTSHMVCRAWLAFSHCLLTQTTANQNEVYPHKVGHVYHCNAPMTSRKQVHLKFQDMFHSFLGQIHLDELLKSKMQCASILLFLPSKSLPLSDVQSFWQKSFGPNLDYSLLCFLHWTIFQVLL